MSAHTDMTNQRRHDNRTRRIIALMTAAAMTAIAIPAFAPTASATHGGIHFGFQEGDWNDLQQTDLPSTKYSAMWATNNQDWLQSQLQRAENRGQVPVVHFYYWGDSISPSCVEFGCDGKTKLDWTSERTKVINDIQAIMDGKEVIVTVELEFNKGGITDGNHPVTGAPYHDTFEDYLVDHVNALESVPGVKTIVAFGEWGSNYWSRFSRAVDASSLLGTQLLWTSQGHTISNGAERTQGALADLKSIFSGSQYPQQSFIYDWAISTWGTSSNWQYETQQATEIAQLRAASATMRADHGLIGFVLRTIDDDGDPSQHWGAAECCFGYASNDMSQFKDGYYELKSWMVQEEGQNSPLPDKIEAEDFATKSTGQLTTGTSYSGGEAWNIWTDGYIQHSVSNPTTASRDLTIVARGQQAGAEYPHMRLHVNGVVVDEWDVPTNTLQSYTTTTSLPAGTVTFRIEFTNDYVSGTQDRNLIVDVLHIDGQASQQWSKEAETMTCTAGAASVDGTASGGAYWNLWSNGHCDATFSTSVSGAQELHLTAKGDPAGGVWPQAKVYVDGAQVATWDIIDDTWLTYVAPINVASGSHTVEVHYVNDGSVNGNDRNLLLDKAAVFG